MGACLLPGKQFFLLVMKRVVLCLCCMGPCHHGMGLWMENSYEYIE